MKYAVHHKSTHYIFDTLYHILIPDFYKYSASSKEAKVSLIAIITPFSKLPFVARVLEKVFSFLKNVIYELLLEKKIQGSPQYFTQAD